MMIQLYLWWKKKAAKLGTVQGKVICLLCHTAHSIWYGGGKSASLELVFNIHTSAKKAKKKIMDIDLG